MSDDSRSFRAALLQGIPSEIPEAPPSEPGIDRAPPHRPHLSAAEKRLAVANALRYFPAAWHGRLAREFAAELADYGHIYMHRFRPHYAMKARAIDAYPARTRQAAAILMMMHNNLDPAVAQFPYELVTYGGNGAVFQNWAQYLLTARYLCEMNDTQTLVLYSGHPLGLFPSHADAPRVILTNGMVIPNYSSLEDYERMHALGATSYGQMTAGSFMYIGPQGIVHGTTITLLGAARRYLHLKADEGLSGKVFVSSGMGGMSGAQGKAAVIAGCVGVIAEVNPAAMEKRRSQGWVMEVESDLDALLARIEVARKKREAVSLGYLGNVVDLWERLARSDTKVELGSDQTSLHNPFQGGYYPAGMSFEDGRELMAKDPEAFRREVQATLRRHVEALEVLTDRGMFFWDYGNAFLVQAEKAGADVLRKDGSFRYPSYVEDIMGPFCFDYGFGPFRWVCASGRPEDLATTDRIASEVIRRQAEGASSEIREQMLDNLRWIEQAGANRLVVGSQARILYADRDGRRLLARAFNQAVADGRLLGPVVLGRDHHDVGGTDSPWRETANIRDGSRFSADMAVQNFVGDALRGATWVSLHNGGGVGWGEVINGGFGLVLDGSADADRRAQQMLCWDVSNGVARRAWARNEGAVFAARRAMAEEPEMRVTLPSMTDDALVDEAVRAVEE